MADDRLLATLQDRHFLLRAYAASSARLMRRVFERLKELQAFRGRKDLAPAILERLTGIRPPGDPVVVGAHLYALELTGAGREIARGVAHVLKEQGRMDPHLAGQLAGLTGVAFLGPEGRGAAGPPAKVFQAGDLDEILKAALREGGQP